MQLFDKLMKMAPTDKVARLYAGGDNLMETIMVGSTVNLNCNMALKNLDEVKQWFRYMGKEFDPINTVTGVKRKHLMMLLMKHQLIF